MQKKNDWLGFTLLPAGVAATFLGIGSFSRDSTAVAVALLGVGSVLLAVAWRLLREPATPTAPVPVSPRAARIDQDASTTGKEAAEAAE